MSNNPYESPLAIQQSNIGPWEIALVERLIAGDATEEWHLYDTSDLQFMGYRKRQALRNEMEKRAIESGCEPIVFQTTLWRCFLFIPILPKGAYAVIPKIVFRWDRGWYTLSSRARSLGLVSGNAVLCSVCFPFFVTPFGNGLVLAF